MSRVTRTHSAATAGIPGVSRRVGGARTCARGTRIDVPTLSAAREGPIGEVALMANRELERCHLPHRVDVHRPAEIFFQDVGASDHATVEP